MRLFVTVSALILVASACSDSSTSPRNFSLALKSASVTSNPNSVLSAIVYFNAEHAESASVSYYSTTDPGSSTPSYPLTSDLGRISVLGLLPNMTYQLVLRVVGNTVAVDTMTYTTAALPPYIAALTLTFSQGQLGSGFTLLDPLLANSDTTIAIAYDSIGRVRWYRFFPGTFGADIKQQHSGHFTAALLQGGGAQVAPGTYTEFTPDGNIVANYDVPVGTPDFHDFWLTGDSLTGYTSHMWGYTAERTLNLTSVGGSATAPSYGHTMFRVSPTGQPEFAWTTWNYFTVADWIEPTCCTPNQDFDHPNVLDFTPDSNYLISFRNFGAVAKVDRNTGQKIWQIGGTQSSFTIQNDPLGFFSGQHNAHFLPNGDLMVFDNGLRHNPPHTRAVEYAIDETRKVATMVWEYEPQPMVFASYIGSSQRISNGNTLVGFGALGQIDEIDPLNNLLARAFFSNAGKITPFYRAYRLPTLYKYQAP